MPGKSKSACLARLSRIEGQVRGLSRMLEEEPYCIDIITQIAAVRAALKRVEHELLRDHVDHCVREAMQGGTAKDQEQKINELMSVIARSEDR